MAVLKLSLEDFDEIDYDLIAIHSSLEDYRLAYFINQRFPVTLSKSKEQIGFTVSEGEASMPKFEYDDPINDILWTLIPNKHEMTIRKKSVTRNLFEGTDVEISTKVYLLPELKKVDYFLKIDNAGSTISIDHAMKNLKSIPRISTVYEIIPDTIKSKNNLIF